jgi:hypothetical protein
MPRTLSVCSARGDLLSGSGLNTDPWAVNLLISMALGEAVLAPATLRPEGRDSSQEQRDQRNAGDKRLFHRGGIVVQPSASAKQISGELCRFDPNREPWSCGKLAYGSCWDAC